MTSSRPVAIPAGIDFRCVYRFELLADFCRLAAAEREALERLLRREGSACRDVVISTEGVVLSWAIFEGFLRETRRRSVGVAVSAAGGVE
jgi:hypothetical protein